MKVREKSVVDAYQWFKNGDHPDDNCETFDAGKGPFQGEGKIVRYYRHPEVPGDYLCTRCLSTMHEHGWIDRGDLVVCPGDWIITGTEGEYYPIKERILEKLYEPVKDLEVPGSSSPLPDLPILGNPQYHCGSCPFLWRLLKDEYVCLKQMTGSGYWQRKVPTTLACADHPKFREYLLEEYLLDEDRGDPLPRSELEAKVQDLQDKLYDVTKCLCCDVGVVSATCTCTDDHRGRIAELKDKIFRLEHGIPDGMSLGDAVLYNILPPDWKSK